MFQGKPSDSVSVQKMRDLNILHQIATGFWSVLDVPDSKRGWKTHCEKYSFCAAMDKMQSFFIARDSTELKYAQLIWDICEVATRVSRKNLAAVEKELNNGLERKANGIISIQYMTCLNDGKQFGREVTHGFFDEVMTTPSEEAYLKYRTRSDGGRLSVIAKSVIAKSVIAKSVIAKSVIAKYLIVNQIPETGRCPDTGRYSRIVTLSITYKSR
jgi:hypothetical protein